MRGEPNPYQQRFAPEMYLPRLIESGSSGSAQETPRRISAEEAAEMQGLERIKDYIADVQPRITPPGKIVAINLGSNDVVEAITPTGQTVLTVARQITAPAEDQVYLLDVPTEEPTEVPTEPGTCQDCIKAVGGLCDACFEKQQAASLSALARRKCQAKAPA